MTRSASPANLNTQRHHHMKKILNHITYTTRDGYGQRREWTTQITASHKLGTIEAEKILKREAPSAIVTRIETLIDSR